MSESYYEQYRKKSQCEKDVRTGYIIAVITVLWAVLVVSITNHTNRDFDRRAAEIDRAKQYCTDRGGVDTYERDGTFYCGNGDQNG